jgi:hypothetical protein
VGGCTACWTDIDGVVLAEVGPTVELADEDILDNLRFAL